MHGQHRLTNVATDGTGADFMQEVITFYNNSRIHHVILEKISLAMLPNTYLVEVITMILSPSLQFRQVLKKL